MNTFGFALVMLMGATTISHAQICSEVGKLGPAAQSELSHAWNEYNALAERTKADRRVVGVAREAVPMSFKVLEAFDSYIAVIRRGVEAECFGAKMPEWRSMLSQITQDRAEFASQHWTVLHRAFLEEAYACIVQAKRVNLALAIKPSPQEFSETVRDKCSTQARAMDAAVNAADDLSRELRDEAKKLFELAVSRAVKEYSSATESPGDDPASKSSVGTK